MSINLQKYCDNRVMNGYGSALLYKESYEQKFHLLIPLETPPNVAGSVDTFDYDLLTCMSKGQVEGKESLEQKDFDFMWHRDAVKRLSELQGRVLDFMLVFRDFTATQYTATLKIRAQDPTADIQRGTGTITPMSMYATPLLDCRDLIQDTITFGIVPERLVVNDTGIVGYPSNTVDIVTDPKTGVTITPECDNDDFVPTIAPASGETPAKLTIKPKSEATFESKFGIVTLKATDPTNEMASWTTTIAVEYDKDAK